MISSVSFAGTQPTMSFEDKIKQPQAFTAQETPKAASNIKDKGDKKKGSLPKTIAKVLVAALAVAGGLAAISKTGVLKVNPESTGLVNSIKKGINTAGGFIADKAFALKDKIIPAAQEGMNQVV